jgi:hypothetical protein
MIYKSLPMLNITRLILATILALTPLLTPSAVKAEEGDFDQLERVRSLQRQALAAARGEDWDLARELAEVVLTLDDSAYTSDSRLILVQALEQERHFSAALYELKQYLDLPLLPRNLRRGQRLRQRLERLHDAELEGGLAAGIGAGGSLGRPRVASAVGILLGGIALSVTGGYFIGVDINWHSRGVPSGTWAVLGTPMLIGGISLDIAGLVLLGKARGPRATIADIRRFERRPRFAFSWNKERLSLRFGGTW